LYMSTLNYIGSKKSLLNFIDHVFIEISENFNVEQYNQIKFLDGFAGSGVVGKFFNSKYNFIVYSNDLEYYSWIINYSLIKVNYSEKLANIINNLNLITKPMDTTKYSLITLNYSESGAEKRKFWTVSNAEKADGIIECIKNMLSVNSITIDEYYFLLGSLISSFDKVANTASVYGAYLKKYKTSSLKTFNISPIHTINSIVNFEQNKVFNLDINSNIITDEIYDIVYLDLPYNSRQYSTNYHPLNFIAKYDSLIIPYGKTGLIKNSNKSNYSIKKNVLETFQNLIESLNTKYIMVSYNNEGLMNSKEIIKILKTKGQTTLYKYEYKKFKSQITQTNTTVYEHLYLCKVGIKGKFSCYLVSD
jgi:adenine-specific DNA-methyltransferase